MSASPANRSPELKSDSRSIERTVQKINAFGELELDWDSSGGMPISRVARAAATEWVEIAADIFSHQADGAAIPYSVAPLGSGGVQLEWRGVRGIVELDLGPDGELGYLIKLNRTGDGVEEADGASWSDVLRVLRSVVVE